MNKSMKRMEYKPLVRRVLLYAKEIEEEVKQSHYRLGQA
jgi:hypothetical protein